jgi:hypothetical protein
VCIQTYYPNGLPDRFAHDPFLETDFDFFIPGQAGEVLVHLMIIKIPEIDGNGYSAFFRLLGNQPDQVGGAGFHQQDIRFSFLNLRQVF